MSVGLVHVERALRPLDELRRLALRALARTSPAGRALAARRHLRVPVLLSVHALAAFVAAVLAPSLLLAVAPLVLGVPHLAADVRHLLLRRASPRGWLLGSAAFALALLALRVVAEAKPAAASLAFEHAVAAAWVLAGALAGARLGAAGAGTDLASGGRRWSARGWNVVVAAVLLGAFAVAAPRLWQLLLLHGHNLIAVVLWLLLFRRGWRLALVPVALIAGGAALLASGALLDVTIRHGVLSVAGLHLFAAADWLAPGLSDTRAIALAATFAFLQSVHYGIWLVAIPAGDRPGDGSRTWRAGLRSLARDLTPAGLCAVAALALLVAGMGLLFAAGTRRLFLSLGTFHGWLELAVLAFVLARGRLPLAADRAAASAHRP
ncbi:MAG TPA: hypothetical protein VHM31_17735 [Polyangia bacterium]|nr:hypothetical protein [Polyangia bacterium]